MEFFIYINSSPRGNKNEIGEADDDEELKIQDPEAYYEKLLNDSKGQIDLPIKKPVLNFKKGIVLVLFSYLLLIILDN
jgi:hypothetical protein